MSIDFTSLFYVKNYANILIYGLILLPASKANVATLLLSCRGDFVKFRYQQAKRVGTTFAKIKFLYLPVFHYEQAHQTGTPFENLILFLGIFPNPFYLLGAIYRLSQIFSYALPAGRAKLLLI